VISLYFPLDPHSNITSNKFETYLRNDKNKYSNLTQILKYLHSVHIFFHSVAYCNLCVKEQSCNGKERKPSRPNDTCGTFKWTTGEGRNLVKQSGITETVHSSYCWNESASSVSDVDVTSSLESYYTPFLTYFGIQKPVGNLEYLHRTSLPQFCPHVVWRTLVCRVDAVIAVHSTWMAQKS
jgi:hypothetical protein